MKTENVIKFDFMLIDNFETTFRINYFSTSIFQNLEIWITILITDHLPIYLSTPSILLHIQVFWNLKSNIFSTKSQKWLLFTLYTFNYEQKLIDDLAMSVRTFPPRKHRSAFQNRTPNSHSLTTTTKNKSKSTEIDWFSLILRGLIPWKLGMKF